jgi:hypothetical protein
VLRISGELDMISGHTLGQRADAVVEGMRGPVLVDVSGLTFIDAYGARALDAVMQTLPNGRLAALRSCPSDVRRILDILALPAGRPPAGPDAVPEPGTTALSERVRRARLHGAEATLDASGTIAELIDTCIRVAGTIERAGLIRAQGQQARAASRAAREGARSRRAARPQRPAAPPP